MRGCASSLRSGLKGIPWSTCSSEIKPTTPIVSVSTPGFLTALCCRKHTGQEAGTLGVYMLCSTIWNHSQPITNSSLLAAVQFTLPLSSFHQRWQQNCSPHSALINNLQRKTTKLVNWHTQSTLTVRRSFSQTFFQPV